MCVCVCVCVQVIASYSAPPATTDYPEASPETASLRMDFKDSDMKRLSMEIERERYVLLCPRRVTCTLKMH